MLFLPPLLLCVLLYTASIFKAVTLDNSGPVQRAEGEGGLLHRLNMLTLEYIDFYNIEVEGNINYEMHF